MNDYNVAYRKALEHVKVHCEITQMEGDTPEDGRAELEALIIVIDNLLKSGASAQECEERLTSGG